MRDFLKWLTLAIAIASAIKLVLEQPDLFPADLERRIPRTNA